MSELIELAGQALQVETLFHFVANQEPNVTLTLYYNYYNGQGVQVSGLWVDNGSGEWLAMGNVRIAGNIPAVNLSPGYDILSVQPGGMADIALDFPTVNDSYGILNVMIYFMADKPYYPTIRVPYISINEVRP